MNVCTYTSRSFLAVTLILLCGSLLNADNGHYRQSPHGSSTDGVLRVSDYPRGSCAQCHVSHDPVGSTPYSLFRENSNQLCTSTSQGGCHADQPAGGTAGYPAQEADRLPLGSTDPGYFESNSAGAKTAGLANRVRWPGQMVWENGPYSAHRSSPNMPVKDVFGNGSCDNCHNVHGSAAPHDMLDTTYQGITGSQTGFRPSNYELCFSCHNLNGPIGMSDAARRIADYYDRSANPNQLGGHAISTGGGYVSSGSRLPCYDCHNPHGSEGNGKLGPNGFLISDQRTGWYGLTDIQNDSVQVRRFCFGCHRSSNGIGGGTVEGITLPSLPTTVAAHASTATAHCYNCHGNDYSSSTSFNVHNPAPGDCITCHSVARNGRRPVVGEFASKAHHVVRQGQSGTVTTKDCGVCHMEGNAQTGLINSQYHGNGTINLRDPDTGGEIPSFTSFSRNLNSPVLEPWVTTVQDNFCLKCHDADGAASPLAQVTGGTAVRPFTGGDNVIDVNSQFDPTNTAYHPVRAAGKNPYTVPGTVNGNRRLMLPPFNQTALHDKISCFDCHESNGHGGANSGLLRTETYYRDPNPPQNANFRTGQRAFCGLCHDVTVYTNNASGSSFQGHTESPHVNPSSADNNYMSCRGCHAGVYDADALTTCNNGSTFGSIHGSSYAYPSGCNSSTVGLQPPAFLFGGYLKGFRSSGANTGTCYANCHHSNGQSF